MSDVAADASRVAAEVPRVESWTCGRARLRAQETHTAWFSLLAGGGSRSGDDGTPLVRPGCIRGQATDVLLRNGGRVHLEAARRPEYATPECGSMPDLGSCVRRPASGSWKDCSPGRAACG
jgi:hypothetical protein